MRPTWSRSDQRKLDLCMAAEHFLGHRVSDALLGDARRRVQQRLDGGSSPALEPVPTFEGTAEAFVAGPLAAGTPVVMRGAARDWAAIGTWSPEFFAETVGEERVRILYMAPEEVDSDTYASDETSLAEALGRLSEGNRAYLRFLPILMRHPALFDALDRGWLTERQGSRHPLNAQLFIGGAGTATALHTAVSANLFVQIHGRKHWKLYAPDWTHAFKPPVNRSLYFESHYDPDAPDLDAFPQTAGLRGFEVELEPGDVLFNPPFWWHKVTNPTVSIGVGTRWMPLKRSVQGSAMLTLLTVCAVDPPILAAPLLGVDFTRMFTTRWRPRNRRL